MNISAFSIYLGVGEKKMFARRRIVCVESSPTDCCHNCCLQNDDGCRFFACTRLRRADKKNVHFEICPTREELKRRKEARREA